jgi:Tol biopolymer transport system component
MLPLRPCAGFAFIASLWLMTGCLNPRPATTPETAYNPAIDSLRYPGEVHLRNVRQLTFGGNNAEAYWSPDSRQLVFQTDWNRINNQGCDQIFRMNADGSPLPDGQQYQQISTGKGRTTCSYFMPDGRLLFGSTHAAQDSCPPPVFVAQGRYVWGIYDTYDIYTARPDGSDPQLLIGGPGYDAEATVSPDGRYVVFTSTRSGDLDLWRYDLHTGDLLQLTHALGYDGGAFFSHDSKKLVWRASRPQGEEADTYQQLLRQNLVEPRSLNLFVANADGSDARQVTNLPGANWAPYFHPDDRRIIFASNHHNRPEQRGREFALFMVNLDGTGLQQITHSATFDAFAMFSPDGRKLVFASNRNADRTPTRDTNIFVADWVETPEAVDHAFQPRR